MRFQMCTLLGGFLRYNVLGENSFVRDFFITLGTILPVFVVLFVNFLIEGLGVLRSDFLPRVGGVIFGMFFPFLVFGGVCNSSFSDIFDPGLLTFTIVNIFAVCFLSVIFALLIRGSGCDHNTVVRTVCHDGFILVKLPVTTGVFNGSGLNVATILITIIIPVCGVLTIVALRVFEKRGVGILGVLGNVTGGPLVVNSTLKLLSITFGVDLPRAVSGAISSVTTITAPLTLVMLNTSIAFSDVGNYSHGLVVYVVTELIIIPTLYLNATTLVKVENISFISLVKLFTSPYTISSFAVTRRVSDSFGLTNTTIIFASILTYFAVFL